MIERRRRARAAVAESAVFAGTGTALLISLLAFEPLSSSVVVGLATAALLLGLGVCTGIPRALLMDPRRTKTRRTLVAALTAAASSLAGLLACFGLAYLLRTVGRESGLGLDLGVILMFAASAGFLYGGLLLWAQSPKDDTST